MNLLEEEKKVFIEIPESLHRRVAEQVKTTSFHDVSEYVMHAVRERLARDEDQAPAAYTKEEEDKIKERLRQLGYL
jgi:Arc/MetJ-type ribon-helix-helix transcriptional regulator